MSWARNSVPTGSSFLAASICSLGTTTAAPFCDAFNRAKAPTPHEIANTVMTIGFARMGSPDRCGLQKQCDNRPGGYCHAIGDCLSAHYEYRDRQGRTANTHNR